MNYELDFNNYNLSFADIYRIIKIIYYTISFRLIQDYI